MAGVPPGVPDYPRPLGDAAPLFRWSIYEANHLFGFLLSDKIEFQVLSAIACDFGKYSYITILSHSNIDDLTNESAKKKPRTNISQLFQFAI